MPRVRVDLPEHFPFETDIPVRITDLNYGDHLGNDVVLALAHEARVQYLHSLGLSELDVGGASLTMADAAVVFKSQGRYGQVIRVQVAVTELGRSSFEMVYRMSDRETAAEVALVKTGMAFFDYDRQKIAPMPSDFRSCVDPG